MQRKPPAAKRRKLDDMKYQESQEDNLKRQEYPWQEKRKAETENETEPTNRRRPNMDIRELFLPKVDRNPSHEQDSQEQCQEQRQEQLEPAPLETSSHEEETIVREHVHYGEEQEVEIVNWEEHFKKHLEETRRMNREREENIERASKKEKSWELLRE